MGEHLTRRLLASTKFAAPALPSRYVPRPRLHTVLDAGSSLPLTVVVGVPGAGKSVLLRSWLSEHPDLPAIWFSCDARDADPVTFWLGVLAALGRMWPDRWVDVIDLLDEADPDLEDVAISLVNDLADLGEPVVLVIDDLHFAGAAAPSITTLVERQPAGCRVIVGSRTEPQLSLHRLRAYGQVLEVRDADLRLSHAEVAEVLAQYEVELTESEIDLLATRTDGWMAGVQMAAVTLRDHSDTDSFLADLAKTPRAITDFLGTEVLDRQTPEIREFMLATAVLDVLDAASCEAVTERSDAGAMLTRVEERNLFLIELERGTYRYHHLFADLLRQHLRAEDPERARALHRLAASYYIESGDPENVIVHLLAAGEEADALEFLRGNVVGAFQRDDGRLPRRLVDAFEDHSVTIDQVHIPDLALATAASGLALDAQRWIGRARASGVSLDDAGQARLAMAEALVGMQLGEAHDIERAFSLYPDPADVADEELRPFVPGVQARSRLWLGDLQGARDIFERNLEPLEEPSVQQVSLTSGLAWVACVEGHLVEAEQVADLALERGHSIDLAGHPVMAEALCAKGRVAFDRGDPLAAERLLERSMANSQGVRPSFGMLTQVLLARTWLSTGQVSEAAEGVAQARSFLPSDSTSPLLGFCDALEARIALETGDPDRAEECANRLPPGTRAAVLRARIELARGAPDHAEAALASCVPVSLRERLDVAVLAARIAHGRRSPDTDALIDMALGLAEPEGSVVAVTDDAVELQSVIARRLRSGHLGAYQQALLDRIETDRPPVQASDGGAGPLSERELTVVRYLASRLTYKEIASDLYVSTNTLKTHVQRIYRKLGVSSRSEAVTEARRLGVL